MKPPSMPESALRKAVEAYLDIREAAGDLMWTRTDAASKDVRARGRHVRKGWPDLTIVLRGGSALLVELKGPRGRLRLDQFDTFTGLQRIGALATVAHSVGAVAAAIDTALRIANASRRVGAPRETETPNQSSWTGRRLRNAGCA